MSTIRTLIADDHTIVRAGIRQFLESAPDIEVVGEAEDGEQAKSLIQSERPDVAVLDIQMPKATGIEVTRWAKANAQGVGILILTAYNDDPYVMAVLYRPGRMDMCSRRLPPTTSSRLCGMCMPENRCWIRP